MNGPHRFEKGNPGCPKHGEAGRGRATKEYLTWVHMKHRCRTRKADTYYLYGARGIRVCDRWINSFDDFLADVGRAPSPQHSIDRIDTNGNYEPGNVRWATRSEQQRNKRPRAVCSRGHLLQGDNVNPHRACRICINANARRKYAAKHAAEVF